nr:MAG TPA: hypothetical protein [Microviridae sp.]
MTKVRINIEGRSFSIDKLGLIGCCNITLLF